MFFEVAELNGLHDLFGLFFEDHLDQIVAGEVHNFEHSFLVRVLLLEYRLLVILGIQVRVHSSYDLSLGHCEVNNWMAEFQAEDGLASRTIRPQLLEDVVELIVDAVVEGEVAGDEVLVLKHLGLKLLYFLLVKVGSLQLVFLDIVGHAVDHDLVLGASNVLEDIDGLALEGQPDLIEEGLLIVDFDVVDEASYD